ncbi:uncharacterized protein LOC114931043 [Nylanderia fulva]|uniref:uncharacterized protein LOC114931043 n=1 Tax=Nylanderia fulva TaxID=613905 RepID=UPI0010FB8B42|nr:uncharacterized protein LOC114931043 [Nylanderia fulva]
MALQDIGHMARTEKFSDMTLPLLWFEIGMYDLPNSMFIRFWIYLNVLVTMEKLAMYLLFSSGVMLLIWCVVRIISYQANGSPEEGVEKEIKMRQKRVEKDTCIDKKATEMDVYSSLLILDDVNLTSITV